MTLIHLALAIIIAACVLAAVILLLPAYRRAVDKWRP